MQTEFNKRFQQLAHQFETKQLSPQEFRRQIRLIATANRKHLDKLTATLKTRPRKSRKER